MSDEAQKLKEFTENLKAAEKLLKEIKIPGKKDSMLKAAKLQHVDDVGKLLDDLLKEYMIDQREEIVEKFKNTYADNVLKFIKRE